MLDGLFRSTFRTKCKSLLNRTKTRLEVIKKRRNAMQKFLKKDIAELLKSNLETNAYGRAEGLYMELNLSSCYNYVEQCCACISANLKEMHKQSECPEQCRVAASSLTYAAARFADLPELRDIRNLFNEKYGKALEPYADKEFVERLKYKHPTTKMKLQLMQEIAQEYSVTWDPSNLEKQVQSPTQGKLGKNDGRNLFRNRSTFNHGKGKQVDDAKQNGEEDPRAAKNRRHNSISGLKKNISDESPELDTIQEAKPSQPSLQSVSENNAIRKPFSDKAVPAPYTVTNNSIKEESGNQKNEGDGSYSKPDGSYNKPDKPRPRSVRTKFLKPSASTSSATNTTSNTSSDPIKVPRESLSARVPQAGIHDILSDDEDDQEEEETVDKLLSQFGKKKHSQSSTPSSARTDDSETPRFELPPPPGLRRYLFSDNQTESPSQGGSEKSRFGPPEPKQYPIRKVRSRSHSFDEAGGNHVHPKLPDCDELAERIAVLKHV